jgi:hypothetical protein
VNINKRFDTTENKMAPWDCRRICLAILTEEKAAGVAGWGRNNPQFAALFPAYTGGLQEKCFSLKGKKKTCFYPPWGLEGRKDVPQMWAAEGRSPAVDCQRIVLSPM